MTLYHWDLPLALEEEYKGWLSPSIVEDFAAYADACFELFPQVKTWTTFNEPLTFVGGGYGTGVMAPGRCSDRTRCAAGDSETGTITSGAPRPFESCACCAKVPGTLFNGLLHRHGELRLDGLAAPRRLRG